MSTYNHLIKENIAPLGASKIGVYNSQGIRVGSVELGNLQQNLGQKLYSFGVISDVHLSVETAESDFIEALTYLNNNEDVAFTCICGDITNGGTVEQFTTFKNLVTQYSQSTRVYATNGNHEWRNSNFNDEFWNTYVDNSRDYVFTHQNDVFIFLGENGDGSGQNVFTESQKNWLETQLEHYKTARIFLFEHYFINNTGNGNYNNLYNVNALEYNQTYGKWLLDLLKQYKNTMLFTGHSHLKFITQELDSRVNICNSVNGVECGYLVHIPSLSTPREIVNNAISTYLYAQSEGVVIDVYADCVVYRGRNFVDDKFIPIAIYKLPVAQGTLPTTPILETYSITNNLTNCVNSNNASSIEENNSYQATISASEGYELSSVTCTMGGVQQTVANGNISITNVTGDIVITASATEIQQAQTSIVWRENTKIDKSTGAETTASGYTASDFIAFDASKTTTITLTDTTNAEKANANVFVCYYNESKTFISCTSNAVLNQNLYSSVIPSVANAKYIKLRGYGFHPTYFNHESIVVTES